MLRFLLLTSFSGLLAAAASTAASGADRADKAVAGQMPAYAVEHADYNPSASARAAETWSQDSSALAPQVSEQAALNPYGPTVIASQPVPDTRANRARYGMPMSHAGKLTAPIGD